MLCISAKSPVYCNELWLWESPAGIVASFTFNFKATPFLLSKKLFFSFAANQTCWDKQMYECEKISFMVLKNKWSVDENKDYKIPSSYSLFLFKLYNMRHVNIILPFTVTYPIAYLSVEHDSYGEVTLFIMLTYLCDHRCSSSFSLSPVC